MADQQPPPRAARISINQPAALIDSHGARLPVVILDLSAAGFRVRTSERLDEGEEVRLEAGKGDAQPARILWVRGDEAGGLFLLPPEQRG
jgi:hypothetical protein